MATILNLTNYLIYNLSFVIMGDIYYMLYYYYYFPEIYFVFLCSLYILWLF